VAQQHPCATVRRDRERQDARGGPWPPVGAMPHDAWAVAHRCSAVSRQQQADGRRRALRAGLRRARLARTMPGSSCINTPLIGLSRAPAPGPLAIARASCHQRIPGYQPPIPERGAMGNEATSGVRGSGLPEVVVWGIPGSRAASMPGAAPVRDTSLSRSVFGAGQRHNPYPPICAAVPAAGLGRWRGRTGLLCSCAACRSAVCSPARVPGGPWRSWASPASAAGGCCI
jgi:hypothetical protein